MDLAVYISELLGLKGEVNLPGIGHFAHVRINGYYNEQENKFYPPSHNISFDPGDTEDEGLATYISEKKNISPASAKYFIEKYVNGLKQQLPTRQVEIAGLGYIYIDGQSLAFRKISLPPSSDPAFFGLQPINITPVQTKPLTTSIPKPEEPKEEAVDPPADATEKRSAELIDGRIPPAPKPTIIEKTEPQDEESEYIYDEPQPKNNNNVWIALLLIVIAALLALLGLYKYKPGWFDRSKEKDQTFVAVSSADTTKPVDKKADDDSITKTVVKHDSAAKAVAPVNNATVDTAAVLHYEILGGAYKSETQANEVLARFQKLGLQPRILKHIQGNSYKITLGTYFDKDQAQKAEDSILNSTKIKKGEIFLQTYNPKK